MLQTGGIYCFTNVLGCDGERVCYDGKSCIYLNGEVLAQSCQFSFKEVVRITLFFPVLKSLYGYRVGFS